MTKAPSIGPPTKASTTDCQMWVVVNCTRETTEPASGVSTAICLRVEHPAEAVSEREPEHHHRHPAHPAGDGLGVGPGVLDAFSK